MMMSCAAIPAHRILGSCLGPRSIIHLRCFRLRDQFKRFAYVQEAENLWAYIRRFDADGNIKK